MFVISILGERTGAEKWGFWGSIRETTRTSHRADGKLVRRKVDAATPRSSESVLLYHKQILRLITKTMPRARTMPVVGLTLREIRVGDNAHMHIPYQSENRFLQTMSRLLSHRASASLLMHWEQGASRGVKYTLLTCGGGLLNPGELTLTCEKARGGNWKEGNGEKQPSLI